MRPKISVLMPAYNSERYLAEAIESIIGQTFGDFEFFIVDDGSSDATWSVIERYAARDRRINATRHATNLGVPRTRNALLELSQGEYVAWLDSDDVALPYRLEHQFAFMVANPDVGICGGYLQFFDARGPAGVRKYAADDSALRKTIFRQMPVSMVASMVRRECYATVGPFATAAPVGEDVEMIFRIGKRYKFANLQEVLVKYRLNKAGATHRQLRVMELYTLFLREAYARDPAYSMSFADRLYNVAQLFLVYLLPPRPKIALFNLLRNSR
jgi:glycosyltransferase involved in cell wall biosynthesis